MIPATQSPGRRSAAGGRLWPTRSKRGPWSRQPVFCTMNARINCPYMEKQQKTLRERGTAYISHRGFSQACPVERCVQMMVSVWVPARDVFHRLGEPFLPPPLLLAFTVIGHEIPIRLIFGKAVRKPDSRVTRLLAIAISPQCLG